MAYAASAFFVFLTLSAGSAGIYSETSPLGLLKNNTALFLESVILMMFLTGWAALRGRSEGLSPVVAVEPSRSVPVRAKAD